MSTKFSIRWHRGDGDPDGVDFHIYRDWIDECNGLDVVHLELEGVAFECSSPGNVSITMPRRIAEMLGILRDAP